MILYKQGHPSIEKKSFNMFVRSDEEKLYLVDKEQSDNIGKIEIYLNDIEYYEIRGEVHKETEISGGEVTGGGSSVGGTIAGGTGAVIGSRKKIEGQPISSKTVTKDERETFLNFFIDNKRYSMFFDNEGYDLLS